MWNHDTPGVNVAIERKGPQWIAFSIDASPVSDVQWCGVPVLTSSDH